jgi:membrane-associated phospholipid phosphatase
MDRSVRNLLLIALACAGGVALLALLFYGSARFGEFDARVTSHLLAAEGTRRESVGQFGADLAEPVPLVFMYILLIALAVAWGRPWQLAGAGALIICANVTTQGLKLITAHPRFQGALGVSYPIEIHYPSGHTTAAMAVGVGLWLIAPPRFRRPAALVGAMLGFAVGAGVVIAGWHFISDVFGAAFVVGFWTCLVLAALILTGKEPDPFRRTSGLSPARPG